MVAGLRESEAAARLARDGYNELPQRKRRGFFDVVLNVAREPMFLLLIACGIVYLLLGDKAEAAMLLGFVVVVVAISITQEHKTRAALDALRELSATRALVIRDGVQRRIASRDVVRDDLLVLSEGDRVTADAALISASNLHADESLLTGESVAVRKTASAQVPEQMQRPGGDDMPFVYSGTLVVSGTGIARVLATGTHTAIGRIGKALTTIEQEPTRVERETGRVVHRLAWLAFALSAVTALVYGGLNHNWLGGFLVGITFAMAILPEELPVVLTVFLGLGAWRMAQQRVLTRHIPAVETLGEATVLCVDKTGTLTQNRMSVDTLSASDLDYRYDPAHATDLPETFHAVLEYATLASHRDPFDPTEKAISTATFEALANTEHIHGDWELVSEYPLSHELLAVSRVWRSPSHESYVIAAKGAPEAIVDLCHLDSARSAAIVATTTRMASAGLRVLGVARSQFSIGTLPPIQHDFDFEFVGLIGLADPVRPSARAAIEESRTAGLRVVMITGDYPATATNIARQIGLDAPDDYVTGADLESLSDDELRRRVRQANVFCRTVPEEKLRLVNALKANGEIVAMTGDGVNDAPALRAAHIGVAMGERGTDVAREAAALVILDDDFSSIVAAVRLGRRIFDNLRKAISFVLAAHVPIVGMTLLPVLLGWPLVLLPVHILFLQLIIDPACSIAFEAEPAERDIMRRPPRAPNESLFDRRIVTFSLLQGLFVCAIIFALYATMLHRGADANVARALTFTTMVLASIGLIHVNRANTGTFLRALRTQNIAAWVMSGGGLVLLAAVLYVPLLRSIFSFGVLNTRELGLALLSAFVSILGLEAIKYLRNYRAATSTREPSRI